MMAPASKQDAVQEYDLSTVLTDMGLSMEEFIDVCILCGCDYMGTVQGVGPKRAYEGIKKFGSIEKFLQHLTEQLTDTGAEKYKVPEEFPFERARELFRQPDVIREGLEKLVKFGSAQESDIVAYLCGEHGFNEDRIRKALERIRKAKEMGKGAQGRLESFFGPPKIVPSDTKKRMDAMPKAKGVKGGVKKGGKLGGVGRKKK